MKLFERLACIARMVAPMPVKSILTWLAYHADEQGRCWPSQQLLADEAGTTVRTVRRVMRRLHKLGMVTSARRFNRSTLYQVEFNADTVSSLSGHSVRMNSSRTVRKPKSSYSKQPCGSFHAPNGPHLADVPRCLTCHRLELKQVQNQP